MSNLSNYDEVKVLQKLTSPIGHCSMAGNCAYQQTLDRAVKVILEMQELLKKNNIDYEIPQFKE